MIELQHVSFSYEKDSPVLSDISFTLKEGEAVGLIGANGAGKSTLLKALLGLVSVSGSILVDGIPVRKDTLPQIRKRLGLVLQNSDHQMFMPTVYEDMAFGLLKEGKSPQEVERKVDEVLGELHLEHLKARHNHKLSGGEKRMAAIATVLAMEPGALLMDEPTSTLDPFHRRKVIALLRSLPQTRLITSHDLDMILDTCDRVLLLYEGRLVAQGEARDILTDQNLLERYHMELPLCLQGMKPSLSCPKV